MNTKEYIESGILEQYAMGTLSAQEKQEVECMSHIYPEIATELMDIQTSMEAFAQTLSKQPPLELREKILGSIHELAIEERKLAKSPLTDIDRNGDHTLEHKQFNSVTINSAYSKMRIAASILLLIGMGLAFLLYRNHLQNEKLTNELSIIEKDLQLQKNIALQQSTQIQVIQNPDVKRINLAVVPSKSIEANVSIYWNKKSNDVYLSIDKLPIPANDKQYQLWAIADGKPVDLGMVNKNSADAMFQKMKTISNAQAFAITLEKNGGVPSPTLSEMYVMGGV